MDNSVALANWYQDKGDSTLSVNYPLTENSIVIDVGGYKGDWSAEIIQKYNPFVHIFEPIKSSYEAAKRRFKDNSKAQIFNFGLGASDEEIRMSIEGYGSSILFEGANTELVSMRDVSQIIVSPVDLISINIEGGEYDLLLRMIKTDTIKQCKDVQIQFHSNYPNFEKTRNEIRRWLTETHMESYNYPFVWESWRRKW